MLAIGGNTALIAVLAFVGKALIEKILARDSKRFELQLQHRADFVIEQLKSQLGLQTIEHPVRFSNLHEKRALAIAEMSGLLAEALVLSDGRTVTVPVAWFPRLLGASAKQRADWELIGGGVGIHWEAVDEDISVASLLQPENFMRLPDPALQPTSRAQRSRKKNRRARAAPG